MASTRFDHCVPGPTGGPRAAPGRAAAATPQAGSAIVADVQAALRALPSHGSSWGWTGRRDRALLVLSEVAGLGRDSIIELTAGDITVSQGTATIRTPGGATTLRRSDDVLICAPCALARWLHALDLTVLHSTQVAASVIARCAPLTASSPHLCDGELSLAPATRSLPVFPVTDAWGPHSTDTPRRTVHPRGAVAGAPKRLVEPAPRPAPRHHLLRAGAQDRAGVAPAPSAENVTRSKVPMQRKSGEVVAARGVPLRLSRYADPMEPTVARRLRQDLDRTAGELTEWERGAKASPTVGAVPHR